MRLNFQVQGDGVPIILMHGFLGASGNWRVMSKRFAAHFKVYSLDLRNHGASPHSPVMHYAAMADDVREIFASENIDRAHLLGHSMGGKVAMQFAADHAGSVAVPKYLSRTCPPMPRLSRRHRDPGAQQ